MYYTRKMVYSIHMEKKWTYLLAIIVGVSIGGLITGIYLWRVRSQPVGETSQAETLRITKPPSFSQDLATWKDPAGVTFQYPKDLAVDKHDEDQENYAHIELTNKDHPGNVIVWVKDVPVKAYDAAGWVKSERRFTDAPVFDATLSGKLAKRVLVTTPKKMMVTATVSEDLLYMLEASLEDSDYWMKVFDTISKTFTITLEDASSASSTNSDISGGDEAVDEEEVVE